tara:strand:+ start:2804 stop:3163 length:360 start_codon:yes stop_codon:yes gene_type:complete
MTNKSSIFVSESISDIIDMDQFHEGPGNIENISIEIETKDDKVISLLESICFFNDKMEIEFTCNCSKATLLMFDSTVKSIKFKTSRNGCIKEVSVDTLSKFFELTGDNKYKCKFITKLL